MFQPMGVPIHTINSFVFPTVTLCCRYRRRCVESIHHPLAQSQSEKEKESVTGDNNTQTHRGSLVGVGDTAAAAGVVVDPCSHNSREICNPNPQLSKTGWSACWRAVICKQERQVIARARTGMV
jgi:hypothetical protein